MIIFNYCRNRQNRFFNDKDFVCNNLFVQCQHSSIYIKTKTILTDQNKELISNDSLPVPVLTMKYINRIKDPLEEFIKTKKDYQYKMKRLESRLVSLYRVKKISREHDITEQTVKEYIIHKFRDPVPYIDPSEGFYFYPQRGTLKCFNAETKRNFLLHIGKDDTIHFKRIKSEMHLKRMDIMERNDFPLEILCDEQSEYVALRYRKEVKIGKLPPKESIKDGRIVEATKKFAFKRDIIACALTNPFLWTIDSKYTIKRSHINFKFEDIQYDLAEHFILDGSLIPVSMSVPIELGTNDRTISFTIKNSFGLIDSRKKKTLSLTNYFSSNDFILNCEKIFSHCHSFVNNNLVYIATSHLLYAFDYRNLKEPVAYWSHQLYNPPMILTTSMYSEKEEIICVSSYTPGDLKIFNYDGETVNYYPYKPHSILDTYNNLRERGLFLLSDNIKDRVDANVTGITIHANPQKSIVKLFTQNYYGDIYENILNQNQQEKDILKNIEQFQLWENLLDVPLNPNKVLTANERILNGDFIIDDIIKFENLPKYLNSKTVMESDLTHLEPENHSSFTPNWKISISEARKCDDLLAKEMMYLWDDVDDDSFEEEFENTEEENGKDKVSVWLENSEMLNKNSNDDVVEISDDDFMPEVVSTQLNSASQLKRKSRIAGF